jgi:4-hydroxythreonine-4-phosphate dehydrogenase
MIYISQGYEKGIGLEIFIKSWLTLPKIQQSQFILSCHIDHLQQNLEILNYDYSFKDDAIYINHQKLRCLFFDSNELPASTLSLNLIVSKITDDDILITLPSTKSEFILNNIKLSGHTEYFRKLYKQKYLPMCFHGPFFSAVLLTDHIPLKDVVKIKKLDFFKNKIRIALNGFKKYDFQIEQTLITGINPHNGEQGILGSEDRIIYKLAKKFKFKPPIAGDTAQYHLKNNSLIIYFYHDQGLAPFKILNGLMGANITFGLPYLRLSVDHGTSENLFGMNSANYSSQLYVLKLALKKHKKRPSN